MNQKLDRDVLKSLGAAFRKERAAELDAPLPEALRRLCDDMRRDDRDREKRREDEKIGG